VRTSLPGFRQQMEARLRTAEEGADTIVWLCLQVFGVGGGPEPWHAFCVLFWHVGAGGRPGDAGRRCHGLRSGAPCARTPPICTPHNARVAPFPGPQDAAALEQGAFYLDRAPAPKHLWLAGTDYPPAEAGALVDKLLGIAGLSAGAGGGPAA
jgi:hypothetical protein